MAVLVAQQNSKDKKKVLTVTEERGGKRGERGQSGWGAGSSADDTQADPKAFGPS